MPIRRINEKALIKFRILTTYLWSLWRLSSAPDSFFSYRNIYEGVLRMGERLKNRVAIVTGAGSVGPGWGNGKATAVLFAREGA